MTQERIKKPYELRPRDFIPLYGIFSHAMRCHHYLKWHLEDSNKAINNGLALCVYNGVLLIAAEIAGTVFYFADKQ